MVSVGLPAGEVIVGTLLYSDPVWEHLVEDKNHKHFGLCLVVSEKANTSGEDGCLGKDKPLVCNLVV